MSPIYRTMEEVLRSPWGESRPTAPKPVRSDRVLRSTKQEDSIYADLRGSDEALDAVERTAGEKLRSFPALSRDVYQSFYSLVPRRREDAELSAAARKFNARILDHIVQSEDYATLKAVCPHTRQCQSLSPGQPVTWTICWAILAEKRGR